MNILSISFWSALLLFLTCHYTHAQTDNWEMLNDASGAPSYRHDDAFFISRDTGYAVFFNGGNQNGYIYKTVNGGNSWTTSKQNFGTRFRCITFLNSKIGFAGNLGKGSFDAGVTDTVPLYQTNDGGINWKPVNPDPTSLKGMCALFKVNEQTLYGVGRVRGPAHLVKTKDAGKTWSVIDLSKFGLGAAMDLYFFGPDTGYVVGMNETPYASGTSAAYKGKVIYTTNGGQSWTTVLTSDENPTYFWKIHFPTRATGYISLQRNTATYANVVYYKTTDKGLHWQKNTIVTPDLDQSANYNFLAQGIAFVTPDHGWIGGGGFDINLLETKDGGTTWSNITYDNSARINKFRINGNLVTAAGVRIHHYISSEINTATIDEELSKAEPVLVYPVPAKDQFTILLNETYWTKAQMTIYDMNGKTLKTSTINKETSLNVSDLSAGQYQLTIISGSKVWLRKILIEK